MPGQPVVLDTLGGLVATTRPEDLPEGASPRTYDTDFVAGRFIQRPGEQNVYSYQGETFGPNGASLAVDIDTQGNAWVNPSNILLNDGSYATATIQISPTLEISEISGFHNPVFFGNSTVTVTFTSSVPAIVSGQTYTFSGLTTFPSLNGKTLFPEAVSGNIATFLFGVLSSFPTTAETGQAVISPTLIPSDALQVTQFNFSVPSTSTITGIQANVKGFGSGITLYAQLLQNGAAVGNIYSAPLLSTLGFVPLGGSTDTWGATWTYAEIDASNFGILLWVTASSGLTASLDYVDIAVSGSAASVNFLGLTDANLLNTNQTTLALDANGLTWAEDVTSAPNVLALASMIPPVPAGSYMKGLDANGVAFMAYSDLTKGVSMPMQYNGEWCDRITQVGPGAAPSFAASEQAGAQASVTAYSATGGIVTLTATQAYTAGEIVTFSGFTGGCAPLNGLTFSILGTGLTTSQFEIATGLVTGSGSDSGVATPQYTYPIVASPTGITQPPAASDPDDPGHFQSLLWSSGPGSTTPGDIITVYYSNQFHNVNPDETLVNAFNAEYPLYVYITGAPFGNGVWQVLQVNTGIPPGGEYSRWYFYFQVPTSNYQFFGGPDDAQGTYQITQATITLTTPVPNLEPDDQVSLAGVTGSSWDGIYTVVAALNSGSYSISQTALSGGTATYTWALISGAAPVPGQLVTVTNTLNADGLLNVTDAVIATVTGSGSGTFTVNGFATTETFPTTVESGQATTAGTQFIIDPGAALVGNLTQSPILGNSGGGTLTVVGQSSGGTFPIGAGTRQGVVFFITRNGAVTQPSPPSTFTVTNGANYITASNIPLGPPNTVARGIAFTEAGQDGVAGSFFYTYDAPVIFTVGSTTYTASALIVPDNVTTTMKFTFSDGVLLASDEIDTPGNNYFNLKEIGDPAWIFQYANRMMYGLCRTKIQNFLNLSFDGGYLPTYSTTLPLPLGWNVNASGNLTNYSITAFQITSNVVTFTATNSLAAGLSVTVNGLSVGTYLNALTFVVLNATGSEFTAAFSHANVSLTSDSGTAAVANSSIGLVTSQAFGNAFQIWNYGSSQWENAIVLFQSAYQDAYNVAILQPNTAYSIRVSARALSGNLQVSQFTLVTYQAGVFGSTQYGFSQLTFNPGTYQTQIATLTSSEGIAVIPTNLVLTLGPGDPGIAPNCGIEFDRIEIFPTNNPVDTTTIWTSYAGNFEAVDIVSGQLGCGDENPQPATGAFQLLEQLYINKTQSRCVTQDSPNYEPYQWQVRQANDRVGGVGPNASDEGEEFEISATRSGVYFFDGGKPMPILRELQSSGVNGSVWELINWNAGKTIWIRNDLTARRLYIGVPMNTPNFYLPNAPSAIPTSPNVILMCNYTGCPTGEEMANSPEAHITMFGDMKALDMRRKWSIWQIACPVAEFITRADTFTDQLLLCNGINSSKIYQLVNGAASGGQNTDDGAPINWLYTTYGFTKAKQGQQNPGLGALRKVWYYLASTMEGIGQVACKLYINSLGALTQNIFTIPLPFTLTYPQQRDQERVLEIGGQRVFVEFSSIGSGGYAEVGPVILDGEMDKNSPHTGVSS